MKARRGLTLVEVLVAMSILSIVMASLSGLLISSMRARRTSLEASAAHRYVEHVLERYKADWVNETAYANKVQPATPALPTPPQPFDQVASPFSQTNPSRLLTITPLNVDGSVRTTDTAADPAPIRRLTMKVLKGGKVRANVVTEIGVPVGRRE